MSFFRKILQFLGLAAATYAEVAPAVESKGTDAEKAAAIAAAAAKVSQAVEDAEASK